MAAEFEADCAGFDLFSGEESPSSNDDDGDFDRDLSQLITISRRGRKRDTSMAFSPVKQDDRKKSRDRRDNEVDDNQPPSLSEGATKKKSPPFDSTPRTHLTLNVISKSKSNMKSRTPISRVGSNKRGYYSAPVKGSRASSSTELDEVDDDRRGHSSLSIPGEHSRASSAGRSRSSSSTPGDHSRASNARRGHSSSSTPGEHSRASSVTEFDGSAVIREGTGCSSPSTPPGSSISSDGSEELRNDSKILSEMHNMLHLLVKRVEGTEKELRQMKQKICSSSDAMLKKKPQIPQIVRSETRKTYRSLIDDGEGFEGFDIGPSFTFKDDHNQACVRKLISEVQALNPSFEACDIRGAAYTYYK